ncbi:MAG: LemA family protein [Pirellulales bacterium]|jgi:LemA protein|nr:LemA family protein [Rhodopirellula sp.]MCH2370754.1 LemA family protein [Pirellulales bacterium]
MTGLTIGLVCVGILVLAVIIILGVVWSSYNTLVKWDEEANNGFADINVACKKRYDLIPNLVAVAKQFMSHERETLEGVIAARNNAQTSLSDAAANPGDSGAVAAFAQAEQAMTGSVGRLMALAESYPELKSDTQMVKLQDELSSVEEKIARARELFNDQVTRFNQHRKQLPTVLFASMVGFPTDRDLLEFEDQAQIENAVDVGAIFDS